MVSKFMNLDERKFITIKNDILEGKPISITNCAILAAFVGDLNVNSGKEAENSYVLEDIIMKGNRGELKEDNRILAVLDSLDEWYRTEKPVIYIDGYSSNTISGERYSCTIKGGSNKIYNATLITDINTVLTGNLGVLDTYNYLVESGKSANEVNTIQCLVSGCTGSEVCDLIDIASSTDRTVESKTFESPVEMLNFVGESTGFAIKSNNRILIVYEKYDPIKDRITPEVLMNIIGTNELREVEASMILQVFE